MVREGAGSLPAGSYLLQADAAAAQLSYRPLVEAVIGAMTDAAARAASARLPEPAR